MDRCPWAKTDLYVHYHDTEWGVPVHDDRLLFEFLILEGAQAGLSDCPGKGGFRPSRDRDSSFKAVRGGTPGKASFYWAFLGLAFPPGAPTRRKFGAEPDAASSSGLTT